MPNIPLYASFLEKIAYFVFFPIEKKIMGFLTKMYKYVKNIEKS